MLDVAPEHLQFAAACPLCGTAATRPSEDALSTGAWRCARCGQRWDDLRLATAAAYATWAFEHEAVRHAPVVRDNPDGRGFDHPSPMTKNISNRKANAEAIANWEDEGGTNVRQPEE